MMDLFCHTFVYGRHSNLDNNEGEINGDEVLPSHQSHSHALSLSQRGS